MWFGNDHCDETPQRRMVSIMPYKDKPTLQHLDVSPVAVHAHARAC
jgi:hypothetical protein